MFDYGLSLDDKTADQISDEITRVNERLFKTNPGSPIFNQLISMRNQAEQAYIEKMSIMGSKHLNDKPLEIGYAESSTSELNLKDNELLLAVVESYVKNPEPRQ